MSTKILNGLTDVELLAAVKEVFKDFTIRVLDWGHKVTIWLEKNGSCPELSYSSFKALTAVFRTEDFTWSANCSLDERRWVVSIDVVKPQQRYYVYPQLETVLARSPEEAARKYKATEYWVTDPATGAGKRLKLEDQ